jgi:tyrosyl-tRNA synthetase
MTADGRKMGKTEKGAVWLDPQRTSPYEYYQFWINTDDRDVKRFLALFTFLPMEEVEEYRKLEGADVRKAKEVLAFEATKIVHGEEEARRARATSRTLFSKEEGEEESVPTTYLPIERFIEGIPAFKLFETSTLCTSGSEARRLIEQGGAYINDKKVEKFDEPVNINSINQETRTVRLRAGKKKFHRIKIIDKN